MLLVNAVCRVARCVAGNARRFNMEGGAAQPGVTRSPKMAELHPELELPIPATDEPKPRPTLSAGGASSDAWCQIYADVLDRRIQQVRDPVHAGVRGAAFVASVGLGHVTFDEIPDIIEIEAEYEPDPGNRAIYDELYAEYKTLHDYFGRGDNPVMKTLKALHFEQVAKRRRRR